MPWLPYVDTPLVMPLDSETIGCVPTGTRNRTHCVCFNPGAAIVFTFFVYSCQLRLSSSDLLFVRTVNTSIGARILAMGVLTLLNMLPFGVKSIKNIVNSDVV